MNRRSLCVSAVLGLLFVSELHAVDPVVDVQAAGPAWEQGTVYTLSPAGMHVATVSAKGSRFIVTIDGVEGQPFDQILAAAGETDTKLYDTGYVMSQGLKWQGPVAFSPDGKRYAYAGRVGKEIVVILDGKEIHRGEASQAVASAAILMFTPDSKHLMFYSQTSDTMQSFRLMLDGQPVTPAFNQTPLPFFSADGSRWGIVIGEPREPGKTTLIVDGKDAGYTIQRPRFTPDGKHVVGTTNDPNSGQSLLVDGKPILSARTIDRYAISSAGKIGAIVTDQNNKKQLYIDGQPAAGAENAWDVTFSPDGKHWAARCVASPASYVVVDGKKHQEYGSISDLSWSPDSSTVVYVADSGQKRFVVVNGQEDAGNNVVLLKPIFGVTGNKFAYAAGSGVGSLQVYHDGKALPKAHNIQKLTISPDGSRVAYFGAIDAIASQLIVDGQAVGTAQALGDQIVFSPDSKHIAAMASPSKGGRSVFYDGQYIATPDRVGAPQLVAFTPDSLHLILRGNESVEGGGAMLSYFMDGKRVAQFNPRGVQWVTGNKPVDPGFELDGSFVLVGPQAKGTDFGPMTRVVVKPGSETSVATWISDQKAAADQAAADLKAADDAKAAAQAKAAADAEQKRADAAAAREKAKEDAAAKRAAALEAKQKARDDAAAKKKAEKEAAGK